MEMRLFARSLVRWWFIPVVVLALALGGVWMYHRVMDKQKAASTVAILQTYFPPPGEYVPPQIGFDALADSQDLAQRIAARLNDGTTADQIRSKLSIDIKSNLNKPNPSLLYKVSFSDKDRARAIQVANIATTEAQKLFTEINTPDPRDVRQAYQSQLDQAQQAVDQAQAAFANFQADNDAYSLPQRRDQELALIAQLHIEQLSASTTRAATTPDGPGSSLAAARDQLAKLTALEPEYNRLTFDQGLAQSAVSRLQDTVSNLQLAGPSAAGTLADAQSQLADAEAKLTAAQNALAAFQTENGVSQLPTAIQSQMAMVSQLTVSDAASQAGEGAIQQAITGEQAELTRLQGLEPQYDQLALNLQKAEGQLGNVEGKVLDATTGQVLPAQAQAKLMQDATIQSNLIFTLLTYALGVFLAAFVALTAVYLLAYFEKMPPTIQELEQAFGRPVITRVPLAGS